MCINSCPFCGSRLLRHARRGEVYWLCTCCRQKFPSRFVEHLTSWLPSLDVKPHQSSNADSGDRILDYFKPGA
ncbi:hypothetical protein [Coleofasciculus sp.]|uniref:hypothetical protein n=1 Tax=Coleofasciculus sp. TaxID=3100458 RepID=UPI003A3AC584